MSGNVENKPVEICDTLKDTSEGKKVHTGNNVDSSRDPLGDPTKTMNSGAIIQDKVEGKAEGRPSESKSFRCSEHILFN